jgi:DNA helicase HerA-like ATPase
VTNPNDVENIGKLSEGLDKRSLDMITTLRVGEALIVGEAVNYPVFFKVRKRTSQESRHETTLEKAAREFEERQTEKEKDIENYL